MPAEVPSTKKEEPVLVASVLGPGLPTLDSCLQSPLPVASAHDVVILNVNFWSEDENKATFSAVAYGGSEG